jgi:predicted transcriptional regulator of viral defense system
MKKEKLKKLDNLIYFTKDTLRVLSNDSESTISMNIHRWSKSGHLVIFKNGIYCTKNSYKDYSKKDNYHKFISSILLKPSYISLTTTLSNYDILSEGVYNISAVSTKLPTTYLNGKYRYRQITEKLFLGYKTKYFEQYKYYEATKAKALFDYIYYKSPKLKVTMNIAKELRLRLESFTKADFEEMRKYADIVSSKKLLKIIQNLEKNAHASL